jgi:hypothetical protein
MARLFRTLASAVQKVKALLFAAKSGDGVFKCAIYHFWRNTETEYFMRRQRESLFKLTGNKDAEFSMTITFKILDGFLATAVVVFT